MFCLFFCSFAEKSRTWAEQNAEQPCSVIRSGSGMFQCFASALHGSFRRKIMQTTSQPRNRNADD
jgi:hypothetical protein